MQVAGVAAIGLVIRLGAPALDRLRQSGVIGAEIAGQRLEERQAAGGIEVVVAVEHFARHRGAGGFAAAGQQRLAQFQKLGRILPVVGRAGAAEQDAAAFGNRREQVGEEGVGHVRVVSSGSYSVKPDLTRDLRSGGLQSSAWIVRKYVAARQRYNSSSLRPMINPAHVRSANAVGVLPVTWRNAWENAGTLA
ncbi:hypothetical protein ACVIF9_005918 [Bradyrhizobium sp. USDA 4350]